MDQKTLNRRTGAAIVKALWLAGALIALAATLRFGATDIGFVVLYMLGIVAFATILVMCFVRVCRRFAWAEHAVAMATRGAFYIFGFIILPNRATKSEAFDVFVARTARYLTSLFKGFEAQEPIRAGQEVIWKP